MELIYSRYETKKCALETHTGNVKYCIIVLHAFMHRMERKGGSRRFTVHKFFYTVIWFLSELFTFCYGLHCACFLINNLGNLMIVFMHEPMTFPGLEIIFSNISVTLQDSYVRINPKWIGNPGGLA